MISVEQTQDLVRLGWPEETLINVDEFLEASNGIFQFHNLANIGAGEFRLMYREQKGIDEKGKPITKMQCKLGRIIYK